MMMRRKEEETGVWGNWKDESNWKVEEEGYSVKQEKVKEWSNEKEDGGGGRREGGSEV